MKRGRYVSIAMLVVAAAILLGAAATAHATHFNFTPHQHAWFKKKSSALGSKHHASKKPHDSKKTFRSPVTGNRLYGKPVKQK